MSDDPNKCAHVRLGMGSSCAYVRTGHGTIEDGYYWRCSAACKAEQRATASAAGAASAAPCVRR
jgi:hypothetical protein